MLLLVFIIILVFYMLPKYPTPRVFEKFISDDECDYIIQKVKKDMETSTVTTEKKVDESVRKSETAWLKNEDPIILDIV